MVGKYFHGGFGVRIVGWLEPQLFEANFVEECLDHTQEISQGQTALCYQAFNLKLAEKVFFSAAWKILISICANNT